MVAAATPQVEIDVGVHSQEKMLENERIGVLQQVECKLPAERRRLAVAVLAPRLKVAIGENDV